MKLNVPSILAGAVVGAAFMQIAVAEQIAAPNQFMAGQTARASQVNENFDVLVTESNTQDQRIAALESRLFSEQMICRTIDDQTWPVSVAITEGVCIEMAQPMVRSRMTYSEIVNAGWVLTNIGGSSTSTFFLFER